MQYRCNGHDLGPQHVMVWEGGSEFEIVCDPSDMCTVTIANSALAAWHGRPSDASPIQRLHGVRVVPAELADSLQTVVFRALDLAAADAVRPGPMSWHESLRDQLLQVVTTVAGMSLGDARRPRRSERTFERVVRRAREHIARDPDGTLSIADLCHRVGVSRRNLHYSFEAVLRTSPGQYLRCMRLNAARRALKCRDASESTIADIAARVGFGHLSHFSADYKRWFGELPSRTAARAATDGRLPVGTLVGA